MNTTQAQVTVIYNNKDISADVSADMISCTYNDKVSGEADEIEIVLSDADSKWQNEWYPQKGATLTVTISINNKQLACGTFQLDEIKLAGPPDEVTIKGIGSGFQQKTRTKRSHAHENKTLSQIVWSIAARIGYTVIGTLENVKINRSTQHRESDLHYLNRLALMYGYNFSVKDKQLIFVKQIELEGRNASLSLDKSDVDGYDFSDKTSNIFSGTTIKFHNPNTNKVIESTRNATFQQQDANYTNNLDTLEIRQKVENEEQANIQAQAAIHRKVSAQQTGNITCEGNVLLVSGNNVELTGFGNFSGVWHILTASHTVDSGAGYACSVELKRIAAITNPARKKVSKN